MYVGFLKAVKLCLGQCIYHYGTQKNKITLCFPIPMEDSSIGVGTGVAGAAMAAIYTFSARKINNSSFCLTTLCNKAIRNCIVVSRP